MKNFLKNTSGNVAMMTALSILPIMLAGGVAVDYASVSQQNTKMQAAVDAALLYVGHNARKDSLEKLTADAKTFLKAHLSTEQHGQINKVYLTKSTDGKTLEMKVEAKYPTALMKIAGYETLDYKPSAAIKLDGGNFEIVLVLDSTFSMSADNKMNDLKSAAKTFIDDLTEFNDSEARVKIGVVPFAQYVNVGTYNRGASWLDVEPDRTENICQMTRPILSSSGCRTETRYNDGAPYSVNVCDSHTYGDETESCFEASYTWNGCVGSRDYPLNLRDESYGTRIPGLINTSCSTPITRLTEDRATLNAAVDALTPQGETYMPAGLTWGLRVLSDQIPFSEGLSYADAKKEKINKVMILMSDGENSKSANTPKHNDSKVNETNKWTKEACDEIKSKDIKIYTISFGSSVTGQAKQILKDCADGEEEFFNAATGYALQETFETISAELTSLYLAK